MRNFASPLNKSRHTCQLCAEFVEPACLADIRCSSKFECKIHVLFTVRGTHNHDRDIFQPGIPFDDLQNFLAIMFGKVEIEQDKVGPWRLISIGVQAFMEEVIEDLLAVTYDTELGINVAFLQDIFGNPLMAWIIFDEENLDGRRCQRGMAQIVKLRRSAFLWSRGGEIRTRDLLVPNQAL